MVSHLKSFSQDFLLRIIILCIPEGSHTEKRLQRFPGYVKITRHVVQDLAFSEFYRQDNQEMIVEQGDRENLNRDGLEP